jgi:DNA-binding HxlR family transcriptional regulator
MAQSLEVLGDRWALLVIRDLMPGPRRFTDLLDTCGGITPKQLATQLRQLQDAGAVVRDQREGRREVWYELSPSGRELAPVVDQLLLWGLRHVVQPPASDEPVHPYHVMNGTRVALAHAAPGPAPVVWVWRMEGVAFTLRCDDQGWTLVDGADPAAAVVVDTTARAWAEFVTSPRQGRDLGGAITVSGAPSDVERFRATFGTAPAP